MFLLFLVSKQRSLEEPKIKISPESLNKKLPQKRLTLPQLAE